MGNNVSNTSVLTSDGQATSYPAKVYWLLVSAAATGGAWQINNSTDDSGTDLLSEFKRLIPVSSFAWVQKAKVRLYSTRQCMWISPAQISRSR